jgi:hypothetical protein
MVIITMIKEVYQLLGRSFVTIEANIKLNPTIILTELIEIVNINIVIYY